MAPAAYIYRSNDSCLNFLYHFLVPSQEWVIMYFLKFQSRDANRWPSDQEARVLAPSNDSTKVNKIYTLDCFNFQHFFIVKVYICGHLKEVQDHTKTRLVIKSSDHVTPLYPDLSQRELHYSQPTLRYNKIKRL